VSTDDGKKVAAEWHARMAELKTRNEVLLDFAKEVALGAYSEQEAQQRARLLVLEQAR
jgi:hypothetical protein